VLIIARISTVHQDLRSLADQIALCEKYVRDRYPGPVRFAHIQSRGSGEYLDRAELAQAEVAVESRAYDLAMTEDLGRICRRNRAVDFCELCEDADTRLVAINDSLDTADDGWRLSAFFASFKHESGNKDTSKRIRRTLRNRFEQGGVVQTFPYGYIKAPGAKSDADVRKDPDAEPIYDEWFRRLEERQSYSEVADWLNSMKVPTGEWARGERWTGRMVARVTHNPILKGYRRRNERKSRRVNKTGRPKSVKAPPAERLRRHAPHLAFFEPARYDRLIAALAARHAACARGRTAGTPDERAGVPKKRTVWPGQHVTCGVCGHLFYWGGHGQAEHMMCAGARDYACWNAATFDGREAGRRLAAAVLAAAESLPEFDDAFRTKVAAAAVARRAGRVDALRRLDRELGQADRGLANVLDSLEKVGFSPALQARLAEAEARKARLAAERADVAGHPDDVPVLPPVEELKERARAAVGRMEFCDPAFGRLMTALVPRLEVRPYRLLDGGAVVLRAHAVVNLAPLTGPSAAGALGGLITRAAAIDLFDPPQRVSFRERVVALRDAGLTERGAAERLGLTVTAAQRAVALHRMMAAAGVTDPYVLLAAPPEGDGKFRRHMHPRYEFRPLPGDPTRPADAA
jgi:site-specific DNA recombinase